MAVTPVDTTTPATTPEANFDEAIENSTGLTDEQFSDMMVEGAITVGAQMILMPRLMDILKEAMSDE